MKKSRILQIIGYGLILGSLVAVLAGLVFQHISAEANRRVAAQIEAFLPPRVPGVKEQYSVMEMPVLQLNGSDYVALLEVPAYDVQLPVRNNWKPASLGCGPHRFYGTVYDGSLIIGGSDQKNQFDFISHMQLGDQVMVTDMTGTQFGYRVSEIRRADSVPAELLMDGTGDLTLFVRGSYSMIYIVVRCVSDAKY